MPLLMEVNEGTCNCQVIIDYKATSRLIPRLRFVDEHHVLLSGRFVNTLTPARSCVRKIPPKIPGQFERAVAFLTDPVREG